MCCLIVEKNGKCLEKTQVSQKFSMIKTQNKKNNIKIGNKKVCDLKEYFNTF